MMRTPQHRDKIKAAEKIIELFLKLQSSFEVVERLKAIEDKLGIDGVNPAKDPESGTEGSAGAEGECTKEVPHHISILQRVKSDPTYPMKAAGLSPDPWQEALIKCQAKKIIALCTRRAGKSQSTACRVLSRCLTRKTYVRVHNPTGDQSQEFLQLAREMNDAMGCPVPLIRESLSELAWINGSKIKAKPDSPRGARGPTPDIVVIDEAAQVSDELYLSLVPMMLLGKAEMMALSTPFGKQGWFFDIWDKPESLALWESFRITADDCPRIDPLVLEEHRATMPPRWFDQEYYTIFNDAIDSVFGKEVIESSRANWTTPFYHWLCEKG